MTPPKAEDRPVSNWPTFTEQQWYTLAIVAVIFTAIIAFFAAAWVFTAPTIIEQGQRVAVIAPFGAIPFAVITFCTVAWRGMVTSRQADQQRLQADQQRRQNDATDDANYAKLLQEGAKLLADDKTTNQMAGVASLSILLNEPKARYRLEAIDVLAETVKSMFKDALSYGQVREIRSRSLFTSIYSQLSKQAKNEIFSAVSMNLREKENLEDNMKVEWTPVAGFASLTVEGGRTSRTEDFISVNKRVFFSTTKISRDEIRIQKASYWACNFDKCKILSLDDFNVSFFDNDFVDCEFSNCILDSDVTPELFRRKNFIRPWYDVERPPISRLYNDWSNVIDARIETLEGWRSIEALTGEEDYLVDEERIIVRSFHGE